MNKFFLIPMLATLVIVGLFSLPSATATTAGPSLTKVWDCDPSVTDHCFVVSFPETRVGIAIRFTVDVYVNYASDIPPTGTVSWSDGGAGGSFNSTSCTLVGFSFSSPAASTCNITYTPTRTGSITITGTYSGDSNNLPSSGTISLTVKLRGSSTTILPNPASTALQAPITFHAKIVDTSSGTKSIPTGTVSWSDGGAGGSFNATSCTLVQYGTSTSKSICAIIYTPPANTGTVTITGTYSGDSTHKTSSGTSTLTVTLRATKDTILQNTAATIIRLTIDLSAKVLDSSSGTKSIPTGTVSWSDGGAGGTFTSSSNSSSCTLTQYSTSTSTSACGISYTSPNAGPVTITGTYSGDGIHKTSSGTLTLTITLRATKTTILPNPATTSSGTPITFHAKVLDSSDGPKRIPTGTVSWSDGGAGGTFTSTSCTLAQFGTSTSTSICAVTYTPANTGSATITGTYSGDSSHQISSGTSALTVS